MVGTWEPLAGSLGDPYRPPKATKNTTGVMFEPSQGVLEAFRRVPQGPRAYQRPPGVSQSVLEHPGSLQECLPGVSWTLEGHKKTLVSSIQRLLDGSDNFVVSLKLFQSVLECFGSLRKRPRSLQECLGAPSSGFLAPFAQQVRLSALPKQLQLSTDVLNPASKYR